MAYLGNGIYDLIDVVKASANPQINYEGLYQDQMPNVLTYNPLKAMTPGYSFNTLYPSYLEDNPDMFSPGGKFYDDLKLRMDFERANQGLPLFNRYGDPDRVGRFENFNPRVGTITPFQPSDPRSFQSIFPTNVQKGIMTQTQTPDFKKFEGITEETDIDDDTQDVVEKEKSSGVLDLIGMFIPGFNILRNLDGQPYERFDPRASIKGGIYSIGNFNQPASLVNDFYNPLTRTNRFDRAAERYKRTGSVKDLFASSRTGAEFFRKLRERKAAKQKALADAAKAKRDIQQFTGGGGGDGPQIQDRPATTGQGLTTSQFQAFRN